MEKTRKLQCSECSMICHVLESSIPKDARQGEGVPFDCPVCQRLTYGILIDKNINPQRGRMV